jgi:nucleotide-binding universal stress UspA family protein
VLHVAEPAGHATLEEHYRRSLGNQLLTGVTNRLAERNVEVKAAEIKQGPLLATTLRFASEHQADLLVIGAGEQAPDQRFITGVNAEAMISHAEIPVLAVRPGLPELHFRRIVCAVDQSPASAVALTHAAKLARSFRTSLSIVSVIPEVSWWQTLRELGDFAHFKAEHDQAWEKEFEQFLSSIDLSGIEVEKEVLEGRADQKIIENVEKWHADLLVMGATGRSSSERLALGATARRLVRHLPCSLLLVKKESVD